MGTITLSVPDKLKTKMDKLDWINWSSVARRAFAETLQDAIEVESRKKAREISEIDEPDNRDFNEKYKKELLNISKGKHTKTLSSEDLDKLTMDE